MARLEEFIFSCSSFGLLLARVVLGLSLSLTHGYGKIMDLSSFIASVQAMGFPAPVVLGTIAALSEFLGGLLVTVGLFTRFASLFVAGTMVNAILVVHRLDPFQKKEFALIYLVGFFMIMFVGPGKISLDTLFRKVRTV